MVKLSNKGKGKPTKRKTLKTKYKIDRKVRQHKKKLRKQMRKLGNKNIKPKRGDNSNTLPNSFPFKAQILHHYKNQNQQTTGSHDINQKFQASEWDLMALQNRSIYFPKDKDHLTKKYIKKYNKIWQYANTIVQVADARNVSMCLSSKIKQQVDSRKLNHLLVVTKIDTVSEKKSHEIRKYLNDKKYNFCFFSMDQKRRSQLLQQMHKKLNQFSQGIKKCIIVGKANTGKHTIIKQFMKLAKFHNEDYSTLHSVQINKNLYMIDTPYKVDDETGYPLFNVPSSVSDQSVTVQQQRALKYLFIETLKDHNDFIMHYGIQDYVSLDDMLKKIGKANRMFGKGGMVNVSDVRSKVLTQWYQGKLNYIFE